MNTLNSLNESELDELVSYLKRLDQGFYPEQIFQEFCRLTANPIIETVPYRIDDQGLIEIFLVERTASDPVWPNQLHVPGTVVRSSDQNFEAAFERIFQNELKGAAHDQPLKIQDIIHNSGRGNEVAQIFALKLLGDPDFGSFYPADKLPENIVQSQMNFLPSAVSFIKNLHTLDKINKPESSLNVYTS
jgi:hypothetical protein